MPDKDDRTKPRYEPPTLVPLGELAKGSGACGPGSNVDADCTVGLTAAGPTCVPGGNATTNCLTGGGDVL